MRDIYEHKLRERERKVIVITSGNFQRNVIKESSSKDNWEKRRKREREKKKKRKKGNCYVQIPI